MSPAWPLLAPLIILSIAIQMVNGEFSCLWSAFILLCLAMMFGGVLPTSRKPTASQPDQKKYDQELEEQKREFDKFWARQNQIQEERKVDGMAERYIATARAYYTDKGIPIDDELSKIIIRQAKDKVRKSLKGGRS